jgi:drug/metabolite transporter (DMT)-like permease
VSVAKGLVLKNKTMQISKTALAHLATFFVMLIYGANYTVAKEIKPQILDPMGAVMLRVLFGALVFWILDLFFFKSPKVEKKDFKLLWICAFFGAFANQVMFFVGLSLTAPINAAVIMLTMPIVIFIGAVLFFKEPYSNINLVGVALGCLGALFIITGGGKSLNGGQLGDILIFLNACSFSIYLLLIQPLVKKYGNIVILKWIFTFGAVYCLPLCMPELIKTDWSLLTSTVWWSLSFVLVFVTVFTYLLYAYGLQNLPSTVVGTYIYTQPVIAAIIAIAAGKDELTAIKIGASLLIFVGVYLASKKSTAP